MMKKTYLYKAKKKKKNNPTEPSSYLDNQQHGTGLLYIQN